MAWRGLFAHSIPGHPRPMGRPHLTWMDTAMHDMGSLGRTLRAADKPSTRLGEPSPRPQLPPSQPAPRTAPPLASAVPRLGGPLGFASLAGPPHPPDNYSIRGDLIININIIYISIMVRTLVKPRVTPPLQL